MNHKEQYREECERIRASETWRHAAASRMQQQPRRPRTAKWVFPGALAAALVCALVFSPLLKPATVTVEAKENLMENIRAQKQQVPAAPGQDFISAQADFAVQLFQKTADAGKNSLVSPTSAALALGMTANGAKGGTLSQFEALLGGGMDLSALNQNFAAEQSALKAVTSGKALLANSIWYRNQGLSIKKPFLQSNADFFGADAYRLDFGDPAAVGKINSWVDKNTGGTIKKMVGRIEPEEMMILINALYLEQEWRSPYINSRDGTFHAPEGDKTVKMMESTETYLHDGEAEGILKPLKDPRYAFAAILPKSGTSVNDYVQSLTGRKFLSLLRSGGDGTAIGTLPKFKFSCALSLNDALQSLGLTDAFNSGKADFSAMGSSPAGNLYIGSVLQKTFLQVDEAGLKAGAATAVILDAGSSSSQRPRSVVFDRPFVIAVVDTSTNLPLFLGVVADPAA
ncbi:Serpin (serine protease inhibitor) [Caprobacter fermentans]|uniref:Serpin (Serine protease inhibitor) n=1 Tax=Caproicibacter fermentans TaxID=2576756 RepID=A0A6N8HVI7_9FIRM|nr:serpin family protein [Caproicibacter fermentans]MVB09615.1 Serpin (serine protease inhibitor) [Caproicibacter fermentans]